MIFILAPQMITWVNKNHMVFPPHKYGFNMHDGLDIHYISICNKLLHFEHSEISATAASLHKARYTIIRQLPSKLYTILHPIYSTASSCHVGKQTAHGW